MLEQKLFHKQAVEILDKSRGLISYTFKDNQGSLYLAYLKDKAERFIEYWVFPVSREEVFQLKFREVKFKDLVRDERDVYNYFLCYDSSSRKPLISVSPCPYERVLKEIPDDYLTLS